MEISERLLFIPPLVSFMAVWWIYFKILKMAKDKDMVDNPNARKLQKIPIPVLGGLAVFFGVAFGMLAACTLTNLWSLAPVLMAMVIMLYVGWMDDILSLSARTRFGIEVIVILGMCLGTHGWVDSLHGLWGIEEFSLYIAVPLTVFAGVGIINAINMIDGVNGLSSGICMCCSSIFGFALLQSGDVADAMLAFSMTAALLPFWFHNVFGRTSKMFIGDSGTMVMGVLMTWFVVQILRHDTVIWWTEITETCLVAFCLAAMAVPVADTVRVMLGRIFRGRDPFSPDKTHLHHIFIKFGMSHAITTATIVGIDIVIALLWYCSYKVLGWSQEMQFYLVVFLGVTLVWGTYSVMRLIEKKNSALKDRLASASLAHPIEGREWWNVVRRWLDEPEVLMERKAMRRERILEERNRRKFVNERGGRKKKKNEKE